MYKATPTSIEHFHPTKLTLCDIFSVRVVPPQRRFLYPLLFVTRVANNKGVPAPAQKRKCRYAPPANSKSSQFKV